MFWKNAIFIFFLAIWAMAWGHHAPISVQSKACAAGALDSTELLESSEAIKLAVLRAQMNIYKSRVILDGATQYDLTIAPYGRDRRSVSAVSAMAQEMEAADRELLSIVKKVQHVWYAVHRCKGN